MNRSMLERAVTKVNKHKVPHTGGRLGIFDLLKRTRSEMNDDHVSAFAGNLTYSSLLAIFPFVIFILSILFVAGQQSLLLDGIDNLRHTGALSPGAAKVVNHEITGIANGHKGALGIGLVVSIVTALWAVSGAFRSVMEAMNVMSRANETRSFVKRYLISFGLSAVVAAIFIVALGLLVAGPAVADSIGGAGKWLWLVAQWPVLFALVLFGLALVYYYAPNTQRAFRFISPGSLLAAILWLGFSLLFSLYVNNFGSYNKTYGTLAGAIVLMLYMYYTSFIFLFGAEVNQVIDDATSRDPIGDGHAGATVSAANCD